MNLEDLLRQEGVSISDEKLSESRRQDLDLILNVVRKINTSLALSEVLNLVLDHAIQITNAERGFLLLADKDRTLQFVAGRNAKGTSILAESSQVSSSVLEDVFSTGESMCVESALNDERFERRESVMNLELQTIMCSPLRTPEETIGVIYVDSTYIQAVEQTNVLYLFEILAGQAAVAIKNARLYEDLKTAYDDLKHANEQIIKSERMAMKGEIAGAASHELKNMVGVVLLGIQVVQRRVNKISGAPSELKEILDRTRDAARKIQVFSQNLLTGKRASSRPIPVSPNKVAQDFMDFVKVLPKFKHNQLEMVVDEDVPELELDVDEMQQVLLNLVNNAIEAFPGAALTVRTEYDIVDDVVRMSVKDNGPGIDEAILDKLLNERITTKADGHGYGLPICRQIVEHHGGKIRITSLKNRGTTVIMTFPVKRS